MKKLLLFDIDGTLLTGKGDDKFIHALKNSHDLTIKIEKDFSGYTDLLILTELLRNEGWYDNQIQTAMPTLFQELDKAHEETFGASGIQLLPGVKELLDAINKDEVTLGLITGNLQSIAKRKLEYLGLWSYFTLGGFGDDPHVTRSDLVTLAIKRAGFEDNIQDVYVIGDAPKDMEAAVDAGVRNSVGVVNTFREPKELMEAGAWVVLKDFKDTKEVLRVFGLE